MTDCIFCRIVNGEIPAEIVHSDDHTVAFRDIHPQAPRHILVIPRRHISMPCDITPEDEAVVGHMVRVAGEIARQEGVDSDGYRLVMNNGERAGQSVFHIHLHLLAGRSFGWPPG